MNIDRFVFLVAGILILISVLLSFFFKGWIYFTLFISLMMIQAAITKLCPMAIIGKKLGLKSGNIF